MFTYHPNNTCGGRVRAEAGRVPGAGIARAILCTIVPCVAGLACSTPAWAQCTGNESLTAVCKVGTSNKLLGKLKNGVPGQPVTFCYDGGSCQNRVINSRGKAKGVWKPVAGGPHQVVARLACGTDLTDMTNCGAGALDIQLQHTGNINGFNFVATGMGLADPATGVTLVEWEIQGLDPACDPLAIIVPTQLEAGGSTVAVERMGARNMRSLTAGGIFDVEMVSLDLIGHGSVVLNGNLLHGHFNTHGNLLSPPLEGWKDGVVRWDAGSGFGEFRTPENFFGDMAHSDEYVGWLRDTTFRPMNGQDPPTDQDHSFRVNQIYQYDALDRLVRTVRTESTVVPAGREKMCYFRVVHSGDFNGCAACPVAGGGTVCHTPCPNGQGDCAGYSAWYDCAGGGKCKITYNPTNCALCP